MASLSTHPSGVRSTSHLTIAFGAAIFLSAFLLFQVQLILGKYFLPWFGGSPAMWTTCIFFFQSLLLAGYVYAHAVADLLPLRKQSIAHIVVLIGTLSLFALAATAWHSPLLPDASWKPKGPDNPVMHLAVLLSISAGLPYLLLSTTGPLLQSWFARTHPWFAPYRLYALSNLGSFLALLSYPLVVEPWFTLKMQAWLWASGFCLFVLACGYCAQQVKTTSVQGYQGDTTNPHHLGNRRNRPGFWVRIFWVSLSACGCVLFLATTNQICQNLAVVPLLWVLPLTTYLLSLVICFDRPRWYSRAVFHPAFVAGLIAAIYLLNGGALTRVLTQIVFYSIILFIGCMVVHGELARSKPPSEQLTLFYLMVAAGGALAGVLVVLVAPHVFTFFAEYPLGLWSTTLLMFFSLMRDKHSWLYTSRFGLASVAIVTTLFPGTVTVTMHGKLGVNYLFLTALVLGGIYVVTRNTKAGFDPAKQQAAPYFITIAMIVLGSVFLLSSRLQVQGSILGARNFYGLLTVQEIYQDQPEWAAYRLMHGRISHGFQFRSPSKSRLPTSYFGLATGVGQAVSALRGPALASGRSRNLCIGVVGLGVGTLAAYALPGDYVRFYEINPDVIRIAEDTEYFTYLKGCPARLDIIPGDARLSMERELVGNASPSFDLLALDAFSGDAPPVHLLTKQAFQIYQRETARDGIIAVNVTNTYIDLRPVIIALARDLKMNYRFVHSDGDGRITVYSDWMLLSRGPEIDYLGISSSVQSASATMRLWTDDYSNLLKALR